MNTQDDTNRKIIPIVFCLNDNFIIPTKVCIYSLLLNSSSNTQIKIFVLYSNNRLSNENQNDLIKLIKNYHNFNIEFLNVGNSYTHLKERNNISVETYFRFLIPDLLKSYPKVIYSDCDIVFTKSIDNLYDTDLKDNSLAAIKDGLAQENENLQLYIKSLKLIPSNYFNGGIIIFNNEKINNKGGIQKQIDPLLKNEYRFSDQDILNIAFKNDVLYLNNKYNFTPTSYCTPPTNIPSVIHYASYKPWRQPCAFSDIWWYYYRNSPFYEEEYYINTTLFIHKNINRHIKLGSFLQKIGVYKMILTLNKVKTKLFS